MHWHSFICVLYLKNKTKTASYILHCCCLTSERCSQTHLRDQGHQLVDNFIWLSTGTITRFNSSTGSFIDRSIGIDGGVRSAWNLLMCWLLVWWGKNPRRIRLLIKTHRLKLDLQYNHPEKYTYTQVHMVSCRLLQDKG